MSKNQKTRKKSRLTSTQTTTTTTTNTTSSSSEVSSLNSNSLSLASSCTSITSKEARKQLIKAIIHEDIDQIKCLLSQFNNLINIRDKHKNTILHIACGFGKIKAIELLLGINANLIQELDEKGHDSIDVAIKHGQYEVIEWLLNNKIMTKFTCQETASLRRSYLHFCCKHGENRILRLLCETMSNQQISLDQQDTNGNTPAHLAAKYNHLNCLQTLVEFNCDIMCVNRYGQTACFIADLHHNQECVNYLCIVETCLQLSIKLVKLNRTYRETKTNNEILKAQMDEAIAINNDFINQRENALFLTLELMRNQLSSIDVQLKDEISLVKSQMIIDDAKLKMNETHESCVEILKLDRRKLENLSNKFRNFKCYLDATKDLHATNLDSNDSSVHSQECFDVLRKIHQETTHKLFMYRTGLKEKSHGAINVISHAHKNSYSTIPCIRKHRAEFVDWRDDEEEEIDSDRTLVQGDQVHEEDDR